MDGHCANWIVDLEHALHEHDAQADEHAGHQPDDHRSLRPDEARRRGDRDHSGQHPVGHHAGVWLALRPPRVEHRRDRSKPGGQHGDDGHDPDPQCTVTGGAKRGARVEPKPAESQDERAHDGQDLVVAQDRVGGTVLVELADPRPQDHRAGQCTPAADRMDDAGAREVDVAHTQAEAAELAEEAAAPRPRGVHRIEQGRDEQAVDDERLEPEPFGHGPGRDGRRRVHEHELEQEEGDHPDVVGGATEHEARAAGKPPLGAAQADREHLVKRLESAEVGHPDGAQAAEGEPEADEEEAHDADGVDHEVHAHRVHRVLGPGEARLDQREAGLHEHDQEARDEQPREVDAEPVLVDEVGQLGRVRLLRGGGGIVALLDGPRRQPVEVGPAGGGRARRIAGSGHLGRAAADEQEPDEQRDCQRERHAFGGPQKLDRGPGQVELG